MNKMGKKSKIGILTLYYNNSNYGGLLQAYALYKKISELGYDVKQISYDLFSGYRMKYPKPLKAFVKLYHSITDRGWTYCHNRHAHVLKKFELEIPHTRTVTAENIKTINEDFDIFVCGSDQIWNPRGWQPTLFLDFVSAGKVKVAYAASLASDKLTKDEIEVLKKYILDFSHVSVREENTASIIAEKIPMARVEVMPDPTLLISKEIWNNLSSERIIEEPYIFAYFLGKNQGQKEALIEYADRIKKRIVFIPYMEKENYEWDSRHREYMLNGVGIREFLSLVKYADSILTDSYHGTIFSLIFNKPFLSFKRFADGDEHSMNSRLNTLLLQFHMQDRCVTEWKNAIEVQLTEEEQRYINIRLAELHDLGEKYLIKALNIENDR